MVNKVILVGYVGKDPEITHMDNNLVRARFSLATNERWVKDGNKTEVTEWHNIVMWKYLAELAEKYVRKGSLLYVEGKIRSRSYDDKDGVKRYITEILADGMNFIGSRPSDAGQSTSSASSTAQVESMPPIETTILETNTGVHPF